MVLRVDGREQTEGKGECERGLRRRHDNDRRRENAVVLLAEYLDDGLEDAC